MDHKSPDAPAFVDDPVKFQTVMQSQRWRILRSHLNQLLKRGRGQLLWPIRREDVKEQKSKGDPLYYEARLAQAAGYNWGKSVDLRKQCSRVVSSALIFYDENETQVDPTMAIKAEVVFALPHMIQPVVEEPTILEEVEEPVFAGER